MINVRDMKTESFGKAENSNELAFLFCSFYIIIIVNHSKFSSSSFACGIIAFKLAILDASDGYVLRNSGGDSVRFAAILVQKPIASSGL
jgi:phosphatidylglycerophosphate synthase